MTDIVFETETSLWEMLKDGTKTWDARRWDMADDRCYRLSWFKPSLLVGPGTLHAHEVREPIEDEVGFQNKATGELLTFEYVGLAFAPWAPGWGFLLLGKRIEEER
jgi:hypothetical protein